MKSLGKFLLLTTLYFVSGKLGLLMAVPPGYATAVWPPSGFAFAGLLVFGNRYWFSIWLGSFLVNIGTTLDLSSTAAVIHTTIPALIIGLGAAIQALVGAVLVRRFLGYPLGLEKEKDVFRFVIFSGPLSCLIGCTVGVLTLVTTGAINPQSAFFSWWTWWIGDSMGVLIFAPIMMMFIAEPKEIWHKRKVEALVPMIINLVLMVALFVFMKHSQDNQIRNEFNSRAGLMISAVENNVNRYLDVLYSLQSFYRGSSDVERSEFSSFVSRFLTQHPAIVALEWDPKVTQDQRVAYEQSVQAEGFPDFEIKEMNSQKEIQRSSMRDFYFPVTYAEPFKENQKVFGFDFMSEKSRQSALEIAWKTGDIALTKPIKLIQGPIGVIVFLAVYNNGVILNTDEDRAIQLKGFVVEVLRVEDIILEALDSFKDRKFVFHIVDSIPMGESLDIFTRDISRDNSFAVDLNSVKKSSQGLNWIKTINLGGRYWQIEVYPTADYLIAQQSWNMWFILAGGLLFVGFLGAFLLIISGREQLVRNLVDERTKELNKVNDQLKQEIEKQEQLSKALEYRNKESENARIVALNVAQDAYEAQLKATEAEKKIRYLNVYQKAIVDNAGFAIIATDEKGVIKSFNPAAERMLGYKAQEVIDQVTPEIIHDKDEVVKRANEFSKELKEEILPGFDVLVVRSRRNLPNTYEWTYIRKDGSRFPVLLSVTTLKDEKNEIFGFLGMASDVSDIKRFEEKLLQTTERLKLAKASAHIGVWDWDIVNNTLVWDDQMYKLYGIQPKDFKGIYEAWQLCLFKEDLIKFENEIQKALSGEANFDTEFRVQWPDRTIHYIQANALVIRDVNAKPLRMIGINRDITSFKTAEIKIAEAVEIKSEFTSTVSHELRTPLTVIRESVSLVYDEIAGPINVDQKDFLDTAMRNVDRLGRLINDVLDYQKLEAQQMEFRMKEQSINGLIEEVAKGFKIILENKGVNLQLQLELSLPNINLDRDKITQVLTNLISNAMKFTDKGSIILRTQMQGHNAIKVSVQDQGIGIKPEDMDKLFKSFSQISIGSDRQTGGTGLGLILCKKIIQNHHGRVGVDSIFGQGSTFYFIIPIREKRIV